VRAEYRKQRTIAEERAAEEKTKRAAEFLDLEEAAENATQSRMESDGATFLFVDDDDEPTLEERIAKNDWITTRGASGSKVAEETHEAPRYANPYANNDKEKPVERVIALATLKVEGDTRSFTAEAAAKGMRLDAYLARALPDVSRARVQELVAGGHVTVDGKAEKASLKLRGGERIAITGAPERPPLRAVAEDIPLDVVYEDKDLAVVNKPAGMMVHAGSGSPEHNTGTLVNALLHRFGNELSSGAGVLDDESEDESADDIEIAGDEEAVAEAPASQGGRPSAEQLAALRPGIVHRLDKQTSGLIVVAKNDVAHRKLADMFASRQVSKTYLALVHGWMAEDEGTVELPIGRDSVRRTRMTTRRTGAGMRHAISHWTVLERMEGPFGRFTLVEVRIETGRTHQIRVHLQSLGHAVVGDTLYGARAVVPRVTVKKTGSPKGASRVEPKGSAKLDDSFSLARNFLHAAELQFRHPRTGKELTLVAPLPVELEEALERLQGVR
jgi:23S rRNA pseudouridine1911/1915/1917 synthase